MSHALFPVYFEWWHIPVLFLTGLIGEGYGCLIGGGSILLLAVQNVIGIPLKSAIAMNNAAAMGTGVGILTETHKSVWQQRRLVLFMMVPITLGGIVGTRLLLVISPEAVKYVMILAVLILVAQTYTSGKQVNRKNISTARYALLFVFLVLTGAYSNFISLGGGTFSKFAAMSLLGLSFMQSQGLSAAASLPARLYSVVATAIAGLIIWPYLITFWISTYLGGKYATRFMKYIPDLYLKIVLSIVCVCFVLYLLFIY